MKTFFLVKTFFDFSSDTQSKIEVTSVKTLILGKAFNPNQGFKCENNSFILVGAFHPNRDYKYENINLI